MNKGKNLLIIGSTYRSTLKDITEAYCNHFNEIYFFVKYNPITEISHFIPINCWLKSYLKPMTKKFLIDHSNKPKNIEVIPTPIFYLPTDSGYKKLGEKQFKVAEQAIKNNNIKFNFIQTHFTWSEGYVGAKLKEKYDVPFVATAHGYDIYDLPFRDEIWSEKIEYVLNTADYIITVSKSNLECIKKLKIRTPVIVIPNGFNSNMFYPRDSIECRKILNLPLEKKIILTVGNLVEIKGQQYLIEAISEVVKYRKDIYCIIIGSGKLKNKLKKQIKMAGLENHVKLAGWKSHSEIPIWMNACDAYVLPSLNEGNPTVMFECLGCGKPFVGTKVGGVPEIIISEDYGLLVESTESKNLAQKILIALDKEWYHEKISKYAEQFTWENIAKEILTVYQHVI